MTWATCCSAWSHEARSANSLRNGITKPRQVDPQNAPQPAGMAIDGDKATVDVPRDDAYFVIAVRPPDELDATVELVAPEERHRRIRRRGDAG